jgi:HEAT repeat protein
LKDPYWDVRAEAVAALGRIGDARAIEPISLLLLDKIKDVRGRSFVALKSFPDPRGMRVLVHHLVENTRRGNRDSEEMLRNITMAEGKEVILQALADPGGSERETLRNYIRHMEYNIPYVSDITREALYGYEDRNLLITELSNHIRSENDPYYAIAFLGQFKYPKAASIFSDVLKRKKAYSSTAIVGAMDALGNLGEKQTPAILMEILRNPKEPEIVRERAARILGKTGGRQVSDSLIRVLKNRKEAKEVRIQAAAGLGNLRDRKAVPSLIEVLKDKGEDEWVRAAAAAALGELGDEKTIGPIQEAAQDTSNYVKSAAQNALPKIKAAR